MINDNIQSNQFNLQVQKLGQYVTYKYYGNVFTPPNNKGYTGIRGESTNQQKSLDESVRITKRKLYGLILCNDWDYWATQTFNKDKLDRFDLDEIVKKHQQALKNERKKNTILRWVIVPEQHEDGAWHLHMFIKGIPDNEIVFSGRNYYSKTHYYSRKIFNWTRTINFGYNDFLDIRDANIIERKKIASYCCKYITKDFHKSRFNKKKYWSSNGLKKPELTNILINESNLIDHYELLTNSDNLIINKNEYFIKSNITNKIFNNVKEVTILESQPKIRKIPHNYYKLKFERNE